GHALRGGGRRDRRGRSRSRAPPRRRRAALAGRVGVPRVPGGDRPHRRAASPGRLTARCRMRTGGPGGAGARAGRRGWPARAGPALLAAMRALVADAFPPRHLDELRSLGLSVAYEPGATADELPERARDVRILVVRSTKVTRATIEAAADLGLVLRA